MKLRVLLSLFAATLVVSGYPVVQPIQAKPPVRVTRSIWKKFTSVEGRFSVLMPGTPKKEKQTQKTKFGSINMQAFAVDRKQEGVGYAVIYFDFPNTRVQRVNPQKVFDGARDGGLRSARGKLLSQRNMSLNGYPGREIKILDPKGQITKLRMYLVNKRFYIVVAGTTQQKEKYLSRSIDGFLSSFRFVSM